jgi:Rrf2 family protein
MFKIHKKIKYALIALKYINERPGQELVTAKQISLRYKIPFDPTARVLQIMAQNGLLSAEQGACGGYRKEKDFSGLSLYDLSGMIVGPFAVTDCCRQPPVCERAEDCVLKDAMLGLNARMLKVFREITVKEMI